MSLMKTIASALQRVRRPPPRKIKAVHSETLVIRDRQLHSTKHQRRVADSIGLADTAVRGTQIHRSFVEVLAIDDASNSQKTQITRISEVIKTGDEIKWA